ncbi:MAG: ribonuclease HI [Alphaproteobacteria bacterium]|nr:ribonuclease HI [Rickettsiales bacterium]
MSLKKVSIYTDGACSGNPGKGGWAALLECGESRKIISGWNVYTTNNIMELTAVKKALLALKIACDVDLCTDSRYVQDGLIKWIDCWKKNGWKSANNKPIKNREIWEDLDELKQKHTVRVHWVKAHNGNDKNELVDQIARGEILKIPK